MGKTFSIMDINIAANDGSISKTALTVASLALLAAVMSKSGQFILHTWLPDAMAGPTPVSALIHAATMVVAGIYMVARLYPVFFEGLSIAGGSFNMLALVGSVTAVLGALLGFVQKDIKKVLAYSTISQLGFMAAGGASGNQKKASESPLPMSKKKCWPMPAGSSMVLISGRPRTLV